VVSCISPKTRDQGTNFTATTSLTVSLSKYKPHTACDGLTADSLLENDVHYFSRMTEVLFEKRYGLQPVRAIRCRRIAFADKDLTEDREWNRKAEHKDRLTQQYNELRESLVRLLDDKIFVAESLRFVISKVTGTKARSVIPKLQYEETDSELH